MYQSFEDLLVWKRASQLATRIYTVMRNSTDFALRDQMFRSAVSIPSNIAEGHERGGERDFLRFLSIAKGSAAELRTQIYIAARVGILNADTAAELVTECREISAMLHGLAKSLSSSVKDDDGTDPARIPEN